MLRYYVKKSFNEELQVVAEPPSDHAWIYGSSVSDKELSELAESYGLDEAVLQDVHDKHELPRVEYHSGEMYIFARVPKKTHHGSVISVPFLVILKNSLLLTLSIGEYLTPEEVFASKKLTMRSSGHVFTEIMNHIVDQYEEEIQRTAAYIANTNERLKEREVDNKDFIKFVTVEGNLNEYHTSLTAIKTVLERLKENKHDVFTAKDCEIIDDISLHANQLLVAVSSSTQTINSIRNAYTTITNNTLNHRMKTLTLLTVLITLPNVFYGMYGMNVHLPFADQDWFYFFIVGFTLLIVIFALIIVRRMRF